MLHHKTKARIVQTTIRSFAVLFACALLSQTALGHVKWFVPYDVTKPPMPIGEVLNGTFVTLLMISAAAVYLFFLTDRFIYKRRYLAGLDARMKRFDGFAGLVMRTSTGIFFLALFGWYQYHGTTLYITPELITTASYVPWLHLVIGLMAFSRYTSPVTGAGIFVLFAAAIHDYGVFHMLDYFIFFGIGFFLITASLPYARWLRAGFVVLFACTGLTLIWASVEKFSYADWTYPLLAENPDMLIGLEPRTYMTLMGFFEFNATFILLGAVSIVGRLVSLALMSVFVLAVFKFGVVDAIGHLMIVAILTVLLVRGPTDAREMLVLRDKAVWTEAYFMTGLYFLALVMIFVLYYVIHYWLFNA